MPFHPIEMGFSPETIELYAESYYQIFTFFPEFFFLMPNFDIIYDVTIAVKFYEINPNKQVIY